MGRSHTLYHGPTNSPEESPHPHYDFWSFKTSRAGKNEKDAVEALQRWLEFSKTTFRDEHVWFDIEGSRPANLQKIKEENTAILRENGIHETFITYSIRHAVITHLARREGADWKEINAYARGEPGSRVAKEYYAVSLVQDMKWILETIGGPVPLAEKGDKSERDSEIKDIRNENIESKTKEYTRESAQAVGEGYMSKRKRSKRRVLIREKSS
ncbi:uncharacterized protein MONOS_8620 [Monocercomonoides exilis]|uniref:uncharacterized protein n=1 Tax=Monocercomonoides exilis TaxID=2049356 RepID=UPI00355A78AB|nr:hypothetical protein MONOS_8620 [Monocercomonoides exilis]|eukprot:MONOS_8620.1-p1 / transcript=MONOS_8620.1 / gene=MONOS_8620 / organism=Monocercomonoides_exilis_PA203 / gene_product=unspecified product / transcript_product=unspecified product / location=Mono_scaffold00329:34054-34801(-) / protein_length=213 / sequence_SO=supercontig / SO=protein_coding / is_pseudo=false